MQQRAQKPPQTPCSASSWCSALSVPSRVAQEHLQPHLHPLQSTSAAAHGLAQGVQQENEAGAAALPSKGRSSTMPSPAPTFPSSATPDSLCSWPKPETEPWYLPRAPLPTNVTNVPRSEGIYKHCQDGDRGWKQKMRKRFLAAERPRDKEGMEAPGSNPDQLRGDPKSFTAFRTKVPKSHKICCNSLG